MGSRGRGAARLRGIDAKKPCAEAHSFAMFDEMKKPTVFRKALKISYIYIYIYRKFLIFSKLCIISEIAQ